MSVFDHGTKYKNMTQGEKQTVTEGSHFCEKHGVNFFKKGKMKGYAHPIANTDEWCNELEPSPEAVQDISEGSKEETNELPDTVQYLRSRIKDHMKAMGWGKKKWEEFLSQSKLSTDINELTEEQLTKIEKTLASFVELK